jgi:hypothetical protein
VHNRFALLAVVVALSLGAASRSWADPLLARAASASRGGRSSDAAALYAGWLDLNPGAPGSARVFLLYFDEEHDFLRLVVESQSLLGSAAGLPGADAAFLRIARLLDIGGRIQEARDAYLAALAEGAAVALLPAGLLSIEMNDLAAFRTIAAAAGGQRGAALIAALDLYVNGDKAAGAGRLIEIAGTASDPDLALKALWILSAGSPDAQIASRFAGSPEAVIASAGGTPARNRAAVTLAASPVGGAILESLAPLAPPSTVVTLDVPVVPQAASAPSPRYTIQAGSFAVKENADELATALGRASFAAAVVADADGRHWKVYAGAGLDLEAAKALLARIQKAGYSGFVTAEKAVTPPSSALPSG